MESHFSECTALNYWGFSNKGNSIIISVDLSLCMWLCFFSDFVWSPSPAVEVTTMKRSSVDPKDGPRPQSPHNVPLGRVSTSGIRWNDHGGRPPVPHPQPRRKRSPVHSSPESRDEDRQHLSRRKSRNSNGHMVSRSSSTDSEGDDKQHPSRRESEYSNVRMVNSSRSQQPEYGNKQHPNRRKSRSSNGHRASRSSSPESDYGDKQQPDRRGSRNSNENMMNRSRSPSSGSGESRYSMVPL